MIAALAWTVSYEETDVTRFLIASLVALGLFATAGIGKGAVAAPDLRTVIVGHLDALNRGDVAAAMAYYADDAESVGTASCTPACKKAGIEADVRRGLAIKPTFTVVSLRETQSGMGYGKAEVRSDAFRMCGVSRAVLNFTTVLVGDKIFRETVDFDVRDAETAKLAVCLAGGMMP
jgi:hypothetical protein